MGRDARADASGDAGPGPDGAAPALAYVALGSNLGDPAAQLRRAATGLAELGRIVARSSLWRTAPVGGPPGQAAYLNAVVALLPSATTAEPAALLTALLRLERAQGRQRGERWGPRTLDLDLLAYGDRVRAGPAPTLPHPRMMARAFVLAPLCEVAPAWRHPRSGRSACAALAALPAAVRRGAMRTGLDWGDAPAGGVGRESGGSALGNGVGNGFGNGGE